jgi:hypothetical protein
MASAPSQASRGSSPTERPAPPTEEARIDEGSGNLDDSTRYPLFAGPPDAGAATATQPPARDVRRCWVCMGDETDDTPENNIWRSPCPCSLTAHEACLLEWIADKEAPQPGQMAHSHEIKCPQCQTPLKIQRPRDVLVSAVDAVRLTARALVLPTAMLAVGGCLYSGFVSYGANAIAMVFGSEAADAILAAGPTNSFENANALRKWLHRSSIFGQLFPFFPRERPGANIPYFFGLPMIAPSLVALRTRYGEMCFSLLIPFVSAVCLDRCTHTDRHSISSSLPIVTSTGLHQQVSHS